MAARPLRIFVASASEGVEVANAVGDVLRVHKDLEPRIWNKDIFKPGLTFIEALEAELLTADFAVLTLTPDDQSITRGQVRMAPRDNLLFELGLFMGRLGRKRTFFVFDESHDLKIPTDLLGVMPVSYKHEEDQDLHDTLSTACSALAERMSDIGPREKELPEIGFENKVLTTFCQRIIGMWWGRQWGRQGPSGTERRLALLQISEGEYGAMSIQVEGDTFSENGGLFARWQSIAVGLRPRERTLVFAWEGTHPTLSPGALFGGYGHYSFVEAPGNYQRADGRFANVQIGQKKLAGWTAVELRRVDGETLDGISQVMRRGSDAARASEIIKALDRFDSNPL